MEIYWIRFHDSKKEDDFSDYHETTTLENSNSILKTIDKQRQHYGFYFSEPMPCCETAFEDWNAPLGGKPTDVSLLSHIQSANRL